MKLPHPLKYYSKKTYLVVADGLSAKIYLIYGRRFRLIKQMQEDASLNDIEHHVISKTPSGQVATIEDENLKERVKIHFLRELSKSLSQDLKQKIYEQIVLVISDPEKNIFFKNLHPNVQSTICMIIAKNLTNKHPIDLFKVIDKQRGASFSS
ncbi:hypothetical protein CO172_03455 [Candidatus Uhrbacteria bacterium CG_4_9_14_3_um_filter_36_7]|uniref:Host attachment protein n=1 Tax=Candidatus Uhrbacteria bacterium CG_4_9_14_3_um_filter_36_7 TaxID=1975033 RepID=A0A2M7XG82_9BACT|nr:MAG: hypothetical protein CO172_03455 [Candidatus Uhrbacteria bacterium CG_4_9_14_3_um_filter_36_7]